MLVQKFDFLVAEYTHISQVDRSEVEQADAVIIRGFVEGGIYHSAQLSWSGNIVGVENSIQFIRSKKEKSSVNRNRKYFEDMGYEFKVVLMDKDLYDQFAKLYEETTMSKDRAIRYEIEKVMGAIDVGKERYLVGLFKNNKLKSALLFYVADKKCVVSYGAKQKFKKARGGVGGVLEMELLDYCFANGIEEISHGKSINPAGIVGSSGIFEFKSRYGYTAYPFNYWQTMFIKNPKIAISDLVFVSIIDNKVGYLVVTESKDNLIVNKYKTKEVEIVKLVSFAEAYKDYEQFLSTLK